MAAENGRLLATGEKPRRARNWTEAEMQALMCVWEEHVCELRRARRNARIYQRMAKRLHELTGERRHREELKMKITNMTFQYRERRDMLVDLLHRRMKSSGVTSHEWPYFHTIDKILSQMPHLSPALQPCPVVTPQECEAPPPLPAPSSSGLLPEYPGSSVGPLEDDDHDDEASESSQSRLQEAPRRKHRLKRRKLQILEAMLQEQRRTGRAVEEVCREVRRVMQQQNILQVQSLQLQERLMNLLERMISTPPAAQGTPWNPGVAKQGQS